MNQFLSFDQYIYDLDRLVIARDEKTQKIAFELFDFNKDRYICYNDLLEAIKNRENHNIYDDDLVRIRAMCVKKHKGMLKPLRIKTKCRQQQTMMNPNLDDDRPKLPHINPTNPEAITYEDFYQINFALGKPQILQDFIKYMTGKDIVERPPTPSAFIKRKESEEISREMMFSGNVRDKYRTDPKLEYYQNLEKTLLLYDNTIGTLLIEKFERLKSPHFKKLKAISLDSLYGNFSAIIGVKCPFLELSLYNILSGPDFVDITKERFLNILSILFDVVFI